MEPSDDDAGRAVLVGPDADGIGDALTDHGVEVTRVDAVPTADRLRAAGVDEARFFVLTDLDEATAVAVARELNPDVVVVVYADGSLPAFASGGTDLALDPALLDADAVAEELVRSTAD